jgi:two-component system, LytTR family, sensor histidine kinase AlgZ
MGGTVTDGTEIARTNGRRGYWLRMLWWSVAASVTAVAIFSGANWRTPWRYLVQPLAISFVFTSTIVPLAAFVMPRVMPPIRRRFGFPFDWVVLFGVMVLLGVTGSSFVIGVLWLVGYIPAARVRDWFANSLQTSVVMTVIFGMTISAIEAMRARLRDTEMALRTKERDEAEARRVAAEAQLASLESRVNPHFLFNTLNSIATLVHDNPAAAERMTTQLAALLRSSLDSAAPLIALDEELAVVRAYLDIERVRFGSRLRGDVQAADGAGAVRVPRLSVQTLVENSVKYAVSPRREGAVVTVRAAVANGQLRIDVSDDGPGFDPSKLSSGHGLALLRQRLAMAYGDRASLHVESAPGRTVATIAIPLVVSPPHHERPAP